MAKKNKTEGGVPGRKVRSGREPFEFLSVRFENLDVQTVKRHLFFLVLASLLTKLIRNVCDNNRISFIYRLF